MDLGPDHVLHYIKVTCSEYCGIARPTVGKPGKYFSYNARVSIVEFIVGNTVEFVNVTMNMTMNPTNSNKASENRKKKKVLAPTKN